MTDSTRTFLAVYVVWHPAFPEGTGIADQLHAHFRRQLYENITGGVGVDVIFRWTPVSGSSVPAPIDFATTETTAIVVLCERNLVSEPTWIAYVQELAKHTEVAGLGTRVFPVCIDAHGLEIGLSEQTIRWNEWKDTLPVDRLRRLIAELTYEFCRMLRHYLERLKHPDEPEAQLEAFLKNVQIFLSHSKHDQDGVRIADLIRDRLHAGKGLASFFDVHDIPAGLQFHKVLILKVKTSAVVAVHTDSYSSREWCRREIIEAKRWNVPLVVANCISECDERGFPYMGNVPVVRMDPQRDDRISVIVGRLLDEVLKDFLWRCRVALSRAIADPDTVFLPRPPELISLAWLHAAGDSDDVLIVYPEPPLSAEEEELFELIAPRVRLRSLNQWLAER